MRSQVDATEGCADVGFDKVLQDADATEEAQRSFQESLVVKGMTGNESARGCRGTRRSENSSAQQVRMEELEKENRQLKEKCATLEANVLKSQKSDIQASVEAILNPMLTKTQISALIDKKKISAWPEDDIAAAFTLRSISSKCYDYLRNVKGMPLPSVSCLKEKAKRFSCEPGILFSVFSLMKKQVETLTPVERIAVLSFDEMSICSEWSYDLGSDTLYKPKDKVQVFMLTGLVGNWKQPVYYNYDTPYSKELLLDVIQETEKAGYPVVAIVHDLGPTNIRMWKDFNIDPVAAYNSSFKNPFAERDIFVFADAPHLMKLIRNNFIDSGFQLSNGKCVSQSSIREMLLLKRSDYSLAHKINAAHVNVCGQQRQRVKYAVQLLSESCSDALLFLGNNGHLKSADFFETANFIHLVDQWFDIFNSSKKFADKNSRNAFGINLEYQEQVILKMMEVTKMLRVKNSRIKVMYQFQKGILVSSLSLIGLYKMLNEKFGLEYIMTRRLNQDGLENFFGVIRQMQGTHDHPNPVRFKYRLRSLLLGKEARLLSKGFNCTEDDVNGFTAVSAYNKSVTKGKSYNEDELENELYFTSTCFKHLDIVLDMEGNLEHEILKETISDQENSPSEVMEQETLRYIGGFIARNFIAKYPHLGVQHADCTSNRQTWISCRNRGSLYYPSDEFMSQLQAMRNMFNAVHGSCLKEGKNCVKTTGDKIETAVHNLPQDVIKYFAKISVYFRMRELNRNIKFERKRGGTCRSADHKRRKTTT